MKKIIELVLIVVVFAVIGLVSPVNAQAISDMELFAAASQVSITSVDQPVMGNQQILTLITPAKKAAVSGIKATLSKITGVEGLDIEGNELECPEALALKPDNQKVRNLLQKVKRE